MAIIQPTVSDPSTNGSSKIVKWVLPTTGDVGSPFKMDRWSVSSIQIFGTTITALAINGSNDLDAPTNFAALSDWAGASLGALAAAGFKTPRDMPVWLQPTLTTGAAVTIQAVLHRADIAAIG